MKRFLMPLICIFMMYGLTALDRDDIIESKDYYYGENTGSNYQQVRDYAIKNLADKLVIYVKSAMNSKISETAGKADEQIESVIQTYSIG
nr:hypothetical protein [Candidatus Cloacimonadota bacterium]